MLSVKSEHRTKQAPVPMFEGLILARQHRSTCLHCVGDPAIGLCGYWVACVTFEGVLTCWSCNFEILMHLICWPLMLLESSMLLDLQHVGLLEVTR